MAIGIRVADYCDTCTEFEPDVQKEYMYTTDPRTGEIHKIATTTIYCSHRNRCSSICDYIQRQKERG